MKAWTNTRECQPRSQVNRRSLDSAGDPFERGHALCHSLCRPGPACSVTAETFQMDKGSLQSCQAVSGMGKREGGTKNNARKCHPASEREWRLFI